MPTHIGFLPSDLPSTTIIPDECVPTLASILTKGSNGLRYPQGRERKTINLFKVIKLRRYLPLSGGRCVGRRKERHLRHAVLCYELAPLL